MRRRRLLQRVPDHVWTILGISGCILGGWLLHALLTMMEGR